MAQYTRQVVIHWQVILAAMTLKVPFFITGALLVAALTLFLPNFEIEAWAEEPVKGATIHSMVGAPHASSAAEAKP
jgi:hypothetical protein